MQPILAIFSIFFLEYAILFSTGYFKLSLSQVDLRPGMNPFAVSLIAFPTRPSSGNMDRRLPQEILTNVAKGLDSVKDLRSFRLTSRACAAACFTILSRHLTVMNTEESLNEMCRVLERGDWRSTKTLTIRNAEWPICSRAEWATHPLLHGGKEQWLDALSSAACDRAFLKYASFVSAEVQRTFYSDFLCFSSIISHLPQLSAIRITPIHSLAWHPSISPRYLALVNRIWLRPSFKRGTRFATKRLLPALNQFPRITSLEIDGNFEAFAPAYNVDHIRQLKIQSVEVDPLRKYDLTDFLSAFKNLESLTVRINDTSPSASVPLDCLHLPHLKSFHIDNMTVSETSLFVFLRRHLQGMDFNFMNMNIWDGDWESVVGQLSQLDCAFDLEWLLECS